MNITEKMLQELFRYNAEKMCFVCRRTGRVIAPVRRANGNFLIFNSIEIDYSQAVRLYHRTALREQEHQAQQDADRGVVMIERIPHGKSYGKK